MFYTMFFILFAALILLCFHFANKRGERLIGKVVKISTVIFISLSMLNVFLPDLFACSLEINDLSSMTGTKFLFPTAKVSLPRCSRFTSMSRLSSVSAIATSCGVTSTISSLFIFNHSKKCFVTTHLRPNRVLPQSHS